MADKAYKTSFKHLFDMKAHVGEEIGLSDWITISQKDINQFAKLTQDEQWIHCDPERCAKESPYGKTIAHGFLVLSFASQFSYQALAIEDLTFSVNYGFDKIRFIHATKVDSRIRGRFVLLEWEAKDEKSAKYKFQITIEIEGEEKPAVVAEWLGMSYI